MARSSQSKSVSRWVRECSECPPHNHRKAITKLARILDEISMYSQERVYYTYVLLDPTSPGKFLYHCPSGTRLRFDKCREILSGRALKRRDAEILERSLKRAAAVRRSFELSPTVECPSWGKSGKDCGYFRRFHFDNCSKGAV